MGDEKEKVVEEEVIAEIAEEVPVEKEEKPKKNKSASKAIIRELKNINDELKKDNDFITDKLKRLAAEFDNYKKRTIRERENISFMAESEIILSFLPVIDNLERALEASEGDENFEAMNKGIRLVWKQIEQIMNQLGIEKMDCVNTEFDPEKHDAVMHIEDDNYDENIIVEDLQKGYTYKDKIIKHSMVKVAN